MENNIEKPNMNGKDANERNAEESPISKPHQSENPLVNEEDSSTESEFLKLQERKNFYDEVDHYPINKEKIAPNETQKEDMNERLRGINSFFQNSNINYYIDGGITISMLEGNFYRAHKDVDISVDKSDILKLKNLLEEKGYGLFSVYPKDENNEEGLLFERVESEDLEEGSTDAFIAASIDAEGKLDNGKQLNYIDVHTIDRSGGGEGIDEVSLPQNWFEGRNVTFNGEEYRIAHPALMLYKKIHRERWYDKEDIFHLGESGNLTNEDIAEVESLLQQELENRERYIEEIVSRIHQKVDERMNTEEVFHVLIQDEEVKGRIHTKSQETRIYTLAEQITKLSELTIQNIKSEALKLFGNENEIRNAQDTLQILKNKIADNKHIESVKKEVTDIYDKSDSTNS